MRPSADCQTTFLDITSNLEIFSKKSLNGHATVVGGHATVGRLSDKVFLTFQAIRKIFQKRHWTVRRQWSEVPRPSADCQTTFFRRFKQLGKYFKKDTEWSRGSGRKSRDRRPTVKQRFWTFQAIREFFEKSRWTVTRKWSEVTRPSVDCQTTFLDVSSNWDKFWKKSLNGHATVVGGHATVGRLSNNVFPTFQAFIKNFEKSHWTVTRQWSEVTRPWVDCQTTFFGRSKQFGKMLKKSLNGHATVVRGHATVGWLSSTFSVVVT